MNALKSCLLFLLVGVTACDGNSRPFEEAAEISQLDITALTVEPLGFSLPDIYLNHGQTLQLDVSGTDSLGGNVSISGVDRTWRSSDPSVFGVDANGLLTAYSNGDAEASLVIGGIVSNAFPVSVFQSTLSSIQTINGPDIVERCVPADYRALGLFQDGTTRTLDEASWSVDDTDAARLTDNDDATVAFNGENVAVVQLTADVDGVQGSRSVEVSGTLVSLSIDSGFNAILEGTSRELTATGTYSGGATDATVTRQLIVTDDLQWSISDDSTALSVSNTGDSKGTITGVEEGVGVVRASCGIDFAERTIIINPNDASDTDDDELSFNVEGSTLTLSRTADSQFLLRVSTGSEFDADLEVSDEVTWARIDNSESTTTPAFTLVTSGDNAGLITTTAVGSADVSATLDDVTIQITVNVVLP